MIEDAVDMSSSGKPSGTEESKGRPPKEQMIPDHLLPGTPDNIRWTVAEIAAGYTAGRGLRKAFWIRRGALSWHT